MSIYKGKKLTLRVFGASHAPELGIEIIGLPCGEEVNIKLLREFMKRRSPGLTPLSSERKELDEPIFISGLDDGFTDGRALRAVIKNTDVRRSDYVNHIPRPGHADFTAWTKYGLEHDMSGGGEFSGRMTAALCIAGGICLQFLARRGISVTSRIVSIGGKTVDLDKTVLDAKNDGDSVGGIAECEITGYPAGLGGELFDGLESAISQLIFAVPAVKGIEFGSGFASAGMRGSENNDAFILKDGAVIAETNNHGGILGGISSGSPIVFRTAVKPTPSIAKPQRSVDLDTMQPVTVSVGGRHDPCIVPRVLPVIEACAAVALTDILLAEKTSCELSSLRQEIDTIDSELTSLFVRRMELCSEIGEYKKAHGLTVLDKTREDDKLVSVKNIAGQRFSDETEALYREIMRLSREYQEKIR